MKPQQPTLEGAGESEARAGSDAAKPSVRAWYALTVVIVATLFGFVDRQVVILVTEPLKAEMVLTDAQIGLLNGLAPGIVAAAGAVLLGWLSDRAPRQWVLAVCIVAWSLATAACGLAQSFPQLLAGAVAIALGEAALGPVFFSMIPDLFPGKSRMTANFIFIGAVTVGAGVGIAGGAVGLGIVEAYRSVLPEALQSLSVWRIAFFVVALPGIPIALAVVAIGAVRRLGANPAPEAGGPLVAYWRLHGTAFSAFFGASMLYNVAIGAIFVWTPIYIMRVLDAPASEVGIGIGAAFALGSLLGVIASGVATRYLSAGLGQFAPVRVYQCTMVAALIPLVLQIVVTTPMQAYVLMGIQAVATTAGTALLPTMLQDLSPAQIRGRILALSGLIGVTAAGFAPLLVGIISDNFPASPQSILWAIILISVPCLALGVGIISTAQKPLRRTISELAT